MGRWLMMLLMAMSSSSVELCPVILGSFWAAHGQTSPLVALRHGLVRRLLMIPLMDMWSSSAEAITSVALASSVILGSFWVAHGQTLPLAVALPPGSMGRWLMMLLTVM